MNKMCDLENSKPNDVSRPSVSTTDRWLFLAGTLALPLATIPANVELDEAQAALGVSINQTTSNGHTVSAYFAEAVKASKANANSLQKLNVLLLDRFALWINPSIQRWLALFNKALPKLAKTI